MSLGKVLNEHFSGLWKSFPCPTDTIEDYDNILWLNDDYPSKEEIQAKIAELTAAEPLRLLRLERDRLIQQTDWEIQRNTERNIDSTELITYRNALRDLPQEIESGNISAPTLDDQGNLIFDNWPVRGE